MAIKFHPDPSTLISFAAGSLPEALSTVVAVHLDMCRLCRDEVTKLERVGIVLLEGLAPVGMRSPQPNPSLSSLRHDARSAPLAGHSIKTSQAPTSGGAARPFPPALARLAGAASTDEVAWRRLAPGLWHKPLPLSAGSEGDLRLIKVGPGRTMPDHGHGGTELTLVLQGAYRDQVGTFSTGDLADLDEETEHQPFADPQTGCVCLIASEKKARFKSLLPRLFQPLTGF